MRSFRALAALRPLPLALPLRVSVLPPLARAAAVAPIHSRRSLHQSLAALAYPASSPSTAKSPYGLKKPAATATPAPTTSASPSTSSAIPEYDVVIIGGGSGGLALSREATRLKKTVKLYDYVDPSPHHGTTWGMGGTCVNVGCIPKKLMHHAALYGESMRDSVSFGWDLPEQKAAHNWPRMVEAVKDYIRSLNWGYRKRLRGDGVVYSNARASIVDANTIEAVTAEGKREVVRAKNIVVAVGGRPRSLNIPGAEHILTSDDIFYKATPPGKTLVIGASYVALECAGFLTGLGYPATVMARSVYLRGFDGQMAEKVVEYMGAHGTRFINKSIPVSITKTEAGRFRVTYSSSGDDASASSTTHVEEFDTVLSAIGRQASTAALGLDRVGVKVHRESHKVLVDELERSSVPNIYAIGDVAHGRPELTPSAIHAGRLLAQRIANVPRAVKMDYNLVPTTVFTPLEYSCVGITEEEAIAKHGAENIEVYHTYWRPLEWTLPSREEHACYTKVVCIRNADPQKEKVLGIHYLGPNAGEVMQGFAVAIRLGVSRAQLTDTVGIHPTNAEEVVQMEITKSSGLEARKQGCCG